MRAVPDKLSQVRRRQPRANKRVPSDTRPAGTLDRGLPRLQNCEAHYLESHPLVGIHHNSLSELRDRDRRSTVEVGRTSPTGGSAELEGQTSQDFPGRKKAITKMLRKKKKKKRFPSNYRLCPFVNSPPGWYLCLCLHYKDYNQHLGLSHETLQVSKGL